MLVVQTDSWEGTMKLPRRQFLHSAANAVTLPMLSRSVWACYGYW